MKNLFVAGLVTVAAFILYRIFWRPNALDAHLNEEKKLQTLASDVSNLQNMIWDSFPLSTIGDTPLAGIQYDPFNPDSIASKPKVLDLYPGLISY